MGLPGSHRLQIIDVDHNAVAGRIIIRFNLNDNTSNSASPGWRFIEDSCAYRGVCDDEWICMTPNIGHPLHSNSITSAGIHYFVWDYHGVGGLDLSDFTSNTSFIVQIALQDTGCNWVDPCIQHPCFNSDGDIVNGEPGTEGNCGPGYIIELDANGCPCCIEVVTELCDLPENIHYVEGNCPTAGDRVMGAVGTQGNCCVDADGTPGIIQLDDLGCPYCQENLGGGMDIDNGGNATDSGPPGQPNGPGGPDVGPGPPGDNIGGDWFGDEGGGGHGEPGPPADGFDDIISDNQHNFTLGRGIIWFNSLAHLRDADIFSASDIPYNQSTLDSGPALSYNVLPATSVPSNTTNGYPGSYVSGELVSNFAQTRPGDGGGTYGSNAGIVTRSKVTFIRGPFGGKVPDMRLFHIHTDNQHYSRNIHDIINPINPAPVVKETLITTRSFYPQNGPILNKVPGTSAPSRGKTSISDGIYIKNNVTYIQYPQNFRNIFSVLKTDIVKNTMSRSAIENSDSTRISADVRSAKKNITKQGGPARRLLGSRKKRGISSFGDKSGIISRRPSDGVTQTKNIEKIKNIIAFNNKATFVNKNKVTLSIVPGRGVAIGSSIYCTSLILPIQYGEQTYSTGLFIRDSKGKILQVASGILTSTTYRRHIAAEIHTANLSPGPAHILLYVFDANNNPIHREVKGVELYDAGSLTASPDRAGSSEKLVASNDDFVGAIASVSKDQTPLTIPIGTEAKDRSVIVVAQLTAAVADDESMPVTFITKHNKGPVSTHYMSVWNVGMKDLYLGTSYSGVLPYAWQGTPIAKSQNDTVVTVDNSRYTGVLHKVLTRADIIPNPFAMNIAIQISSKNNDNKISWVDLFAGKGFELRSFSLDSTEDNGDGTFDVTITTPFAFMTMALFKSGGNNYVPEDPTLATDKVPFSGTASFTSFTVAKGEWVGISLHEFPGNLASRTYAFFQIPY
jgi:hypothetical protein